MLPPPQLNFQIKPGWMKTAECTANFTIWSLIVSEMWETIFEGAASVTLVPNIAQFTLAMAWGKSARHTPLILHVEPPPLSQVPHFGEIFRRCLIWEASKCRQVYVLSPHPFTKSGLSFLVGYMKMYKQLVPPVYELRNRNCVNRVCSKRGQMHNQFYVLSSHHFNIIGGQYSNVLITAHNKLPTVE